MVPENAAANLSDWMCQGMVNADSCVSAACQVPKAKVLLMALGFLFIIATLYPAGMKLPERKSADTIMFLIGVALFLYGFLTVLP